MSTLSNVLKSETNIVPRAVPVHEEPVVLPPTRGPGPILAPVYEITVSVCHGRGFRASCQAATCIGKSRAESLGLLVLELQSLHKTPFPVQLV